MRAEFLNEIHDVQILRTFRLVRGLISVLRNVSAAGTFPFSFDLVGSCEKPQNVLRMSSEGHQKVLRKYIAYLYIYFKYILVSTKRKH